MEKSIRLADGTARHYYPLPIAGQADWHRESACCWRTSVQFDDTPADTIIVPSFSLLGSTYRYQFHLRGTGEPNLQVALNPVPAVPGEQAPNNLSNNIQANNRQASNSQASNSQAGNNQADNKQAESSPVSAHIDCWHSHQKLHKLSIELSVELPADWSGPPQNYLLCVSRRPLEQTPPHPPSEEHAVAVANQPVAYSQMEAAKEIKHRTCSPTALAMALSRFPQPPAWQATIDACFDPQTRAYGAWPLAVMWAGRCGVHAAVETFTEWDSVLQVLRQGVPIVCSIRFARDALPGAPLAQTGGHLVLLTGVAGDWVTVYDPAAPSANEVARRYPAADFSTAWLQRRGAGYVFSNYQLAAP